MKSICGSLLSTGSTKGCSCDKELRRRETIHSSYLQNYGYDDDLCCMYGVTSNTGKKFLFDRNDFDEIKKYIWSEQIKDIFMHEYLQIRKCFYIG